MVIKISELKSKVNDTLVFKKKGKEITVEGKFKT